MKWLISPLAALVTGGAAAVINPGNALVAVGVSGVGAIAGASIAQTSKQKRPGETISSKYIDNIKNEFEQILKEEFKRLKTQTESESISFHRELKKVADSQQHVTTSVQDLAQGMQAVQTDLNKGKTEQQTTFLKSIDNIKNEFEQILKEEFKRLKTQTESESISFHRELKKVADSQQHVTTSVQDLAQGIQAVQTDLNKGKTEQQTTFSESIDNIKNELKQILKEGFDHLKQQTEPKPVSQFHDELKAAADSLEQHVTTSVQDLAQGIQAVQNELNKGKRIVQPQTAILYDIENFIFNKGKKINPKILEEKISFDEILKNIKDHVDIGDVIIQRAYANWMNQVLHPLKTEETEISVDCIQVYGANHEQKNAADIHLSLDAVDLLHQYPTINTYVIVSGDGGFGSLALKLRDYGKTVIGCAYHGSASASLQKVCHHFVLIENPFLESDTSPPRIITKPPIITRPPIITEPPKSKLSKFNQPLQKKINIIQYENPTNPSKIKENELAKIAEIFQCYMDMPEYSAKLVTGIDISLVKEAINFFIPDLEPLRYQAIKFSDVIRYTCQNIKKELYLANAIQGYSCSSTAILCFKDRIPEGFKTNEYTPVFVHQEWIYYRLFPGKLAGFPVLQVVADWAVTQRPKNMLVAQAVKSIIQQPKPVERKYGKLAIRRAINNYASAKLLIIQINKDQHIMTINLKIKTADDMIKALKAHVHEVLEKRLTLIGEKIDEHIFQQLFEYHISEFNNAENMNTTTSE
ncbi:NYN domain-containing protein [Candidatus Synechococcus calcipolaris G9]|uniref:NYN domain-containing protein n=1 Tax=Candidatus Synechococcus calcipolaris G9 TaxID=1497997 RepID=A0ABT6F391_9SYNE|nr:NYN domain-containing protein [Candidatus Synechococcus calcipolaris]MDG2992334.1 NYN domain-containing protein [Candidatus Synechococcus calcipolaris G9]